MFKPQGVYVAMLTPFQDDGSINEGEVRRLVDFLIERGVDGLFPVSSVGEFVHLSFAQKVRLIQIVAEQAAGRVAVVPGVGSSEPRQAIRLAQAAKEAGCDGVVVAPPYFYPLDASMVEQYFETIAQAIELPLILYNIPLFTQPISYEVVARLSRRANVVGLKDSSGSIVDFLHFRDEVRLAGGEISFLTGREEAFLACLMMGGQGCMVATAGILPEIMVGIYESWRKGDLDAACRLQLSILQLIRAFFSLPFPVGFKPALEVRGFKMGGPIQPLSPAWQEKYATVASRIEALLKPLLAGIVKG